LPRSRLDRVNSVATAELAGHLHLLEAVPGSRRSPPVETDTEVVAVQALTRMACGFDQHDAPHRETRAGTNRRLHLTDSLPNETGCGGPSIQTAGSRASS
jgi:hypothetical protein